MNKLSWYDVSEDVKDLLVLATDNWENTTLSEQYINEALEKAGNNLDVLVGAYRFFFYKNQPEIALKIAKKVLRIVEATENLPLEWEQLKPILVECQNEPSIRLYLNSYASQGFVLAKLGQLEAAKLITERVKEIDEHRESCATTVFEVLTKAPDEDDD
jgi:tetratricopeptide (TPR) repeat protein